MSAEIQIKDQRKRNTAYFDIELDDAGLDPYAFRAYCRIARRAAGHDTGACTESVENMADGCNMSRRTMVRALRDLIRRRMIQRVSRQGYTSVYALTDKSQWRALPLEAVKESLTVAEPGAPNAHPPGASGAHPQCTTCPPPGAPRAHKEDKISTQKRRESAPARTVDPQRPALSVVPSPAPHRGPNDDFEADAPLVPTWTVGERFVLKACGLWETSRVETDWKIRDAVRKAGAFVMARIRPTEGVGGTPTLWQEFWFEILGKKTNPHPDWLVEQWTAYDRWLMQTHEAHRAHNAVA